MAVHRRANLGIFFNRADIGGKSKRFGTIALSHQPRGKTSGRNRPAIDERQHRLCLGSLKPDKNLPGLNDRAILHKDFTDDTALEMLDGLAPAIDHHLTGGDCGSI